MNKADGNCAFDAVINNINNRQCYSEKLDISSEIYRQIWVTELEMESSHYPSLGAGYSEEEKRENWNVLKQSGVYEIDFFGDLVMNAIARGCPKNILIFNTSLDAADPIYVIKADEFGGFADSDIPVVVGYNQVHYESLHSITQSDIELTKHLVTSYIEGTYEYKKNDIPFLISTSEIELNKNVPDRIILNDKEFPPLSSSKVSRNLSSSRRNPSARIAEQKQNVKRKLTLPLRE